MGLASTTFVWAAPGQSPVRQTLPTKTPTDTPKEEKDTPTPVPTLTNPTPTPRTGVATPVGTVVSPPPPQTLPASGARFSTFSLVLMAAGVWLVYVGWSLRRRARG